MPIKIRAHDTIEFVLARSDPIDSVQQPGLDEIGTTGRGGGGCVMRGEFRTVIHTDSRNGVQSGVTGEHPSRRQHHLPIACLGSSETMKGIMASGQNGCRMKGAQCAPERGQDNTSVV